MKFSNNTALIRICLKGYPLKKCLPTPFLHPDEQWRYYTDIKKKCKWCLGTYLIYIAVQKFLAGKSQKFGRTFTIYPLGICSFKKVQVVPYVKKLVATQNINNIVVVVGAGSAITGL
jgi:hypothetical protein